MTSIFLSSLRLLPAQMERELALRQEAELQQLLPVLGPVFGLVIILFAGWDYLVDPAHASLTLGVRLACVVIGTLAYVPVPFSCSILQRCAFQYWAHAGGVIVSTFFLKDGILFGMPMIAVTMFMVSLMTLRLRTFLLILSLPSGIFFVLAAIRLPLFEFLNCVILYLLAVGVAIIVLLVIRYFRQQAFLFEHELLEISRHDSLTGACNRSYLSELATREIALAKRHGRPLAIAMLDIDHFKKVNDTYGHETGDKVIQLLVTTCTRNLREIDHFGRIGGEEFACVLPETAEADALQCAERLRLAIEALCMSTPQGDIRFTVSIGVALLAPSHQDWAALLNDADTALYQAKREGRNRVILSRPPP